MRQLNVFQTEKEAGGKPAVVNECRKCALLYIVSPVQKAVNKKDPYSSTSVSN